MSAQSVEAEEEPMGLAEVESNGPLLLVTAAMKSTAAVFMDGLREKALCRELSQPRVLVQGTDDLARWTDQRLST